MELRNNYYQNWVYHQKIPIQIYSEMRVFFKRPDTNENVEVESYLVKFISMDYKEIFERIDVNENKIREVKSDLRKLKLIAKNMQLSGTPEIMQMFDEKYRIEYALKLTNNKRFETSIILKISERNLYRLMKQHKLN